MVPTRGRGGVGSWKVMQGPNRVITSMHSAGGGDVGGLWVFSVL